MIGFERPIATLRIFHLLSLALAWCFGIVGAATCTYRFPIDKEEADCKLQV